MKMFQLKRYTLLLAIGLVAIAVLGRLLPHAWNATPLIAVSLFAGVYLGRRWALLVPIVAMVISDFFIGFYNPTMMFAVYGAFVLVGLIGFILRKYKSVLVIFVASLFASTVFFFITNAAVWAFNSFYQPGLAGLVEALLAGVPFYKNMLMGDLMYTALLFGAYAAYRSVLRYYNVKKHSAHGLQIVCTEESPLI